MMGLGIRIGNVKNRALSIMVGYDMFLSTNTGVGTLRSANQVNTQSIDASNYSFILLDNLVTLPVDFFIEWVTADDISAGSGTWSVVGNTSSTRNYIYYNGVNIVLRAQGGSTEQLPVNLANNTITRLIRLAGVWYVQQDQVQIYTEPSSNQIQFQFDNIGSKRSDSVIGNGEHKFINLNDSHIYLATEGEGTIYRDLIGGNHGTLTEVGTGIADWTTGVATPESAGTQIALMSYNKYANPPVLPTTNGTLIIPEDPNNLGFDLLGNAIERPYLINGFNWSGQLGHHLDIESILQHATKGVLGVEFNNGGKNTARPAIGWSFAGAFKIGIKGYFTGGDIVYPLGVYTGDTGTNFIRLSTVVGQEVKIKIGSSTVNFDTSGVSTSGKFLIVSRDGANNLALTIDGGAPIVGSGTASGTFSPTQVGLRDVNLGDVIDMVHLNMNDENIYVFDERSDSTIEDKIGSKDLTLTDIGNGLPTYVRSDDAITFIVDDGEIIGGSTLMGWILRKDVDSLMNVMGDDKMIIETNLDELDFEFNSVITPSNVTVNADDWAWAQFVTDGFGLGLVYIGGVGASNSVLVASGLTGEAIAAIQNFLVGNKDAAENSANAYTSQTIHYPRRVSQIGGEIARIITNDKVENLP